MRTMRTIVSGLAGAGMLAATCAALAAATPAGTNAPKLAGEYVEARSCNVYTGACHANGELVTAGREAILAWQVDRGTYKGVRLDGLRAVAVMTGVDNLAQPDAQRRTVLYVDARATGAQCKALAGALIDKYGAALGTVEAVKNAPVEFEHSGMDYTVRVPGVAFLRTTRYACNECVMPHAVWYAPFVPLKSSIVARAAVNEFKGSPELGRTWRREDENSSFVGDFAF